MRWFDILFVVGLAVWVVGLLVSWTPDLPRWWSPDGNLFELAGGALRRVGGAVLFVGALIHVIVQFT